MKKIICIGSATKDVFLLLDDVKIIDNHQDLTAKKLMAFEYGAKVYAEKLVENVGGSAVNVGAGLVRCDLKPFIFARTSKGESGKWILKQIGKLKIKKNYMQQTGGDESETAVIVVDKKTIDHVILRTGDSVAGFDLEKALEKFDEKVHWIFVSSQKENWGEKMNLVVDFAKKKNSLIALNPSGFQISNNPKELVEFFAHCEIIFLNRDEAIELVQKVEGNVQDEIKFLFEKILNYGSKILVITDGENGAYVGNKEYVYFLEISVDKKVDAVGAGDAFCSGFLSSYIEDQDLRKSLAWGIANSGSSVGRIGGIEGLLTKKNLAIRGESLISKIKEID